MPEEEEEIAIGDWVRVQDTSAGFPQRPGGVTDIKESAAGPLFTIEWKGKTADFCEHCSSKAGDDLELVRKSTEV